MATFVVDVELTVCPGRRGTEYGSKEGNDNVNVGKRDAFRSVRPTGSGGQS